MKIVIEFSEELKDHGVTRVSIRVKRSKEVLFEATKTDARGLDKSVREAYIAEQCRALGASLPTFLRETEHDNQAG
jgi:hypothetical protein